MVRFKELGAEEEAVCLKVRLQESHRLHLHSPKDLLAVWKIKLNAYIPHNKGQFWITIFQKATGKNQ